MKYNKERTEKTILEYTGEELDNLSTLYFFINDFIDRAKVIDPSAFQDIIDEWES